LDGTVATASRHTDLTTNWLLKKSLVDFFNLAYPVLTKDTGLRKTLGVVFARSRNQVPTFMDLGT
jgi:hypothetical protein